MKIEIDIPEGLLREIESLSKMFYHSKEEYILEKIRTGLTVDEKSAKYRKDYRYNEGVAEA